MSPRTVKLARIEAGQSHLKDYLIALARRRTPGDFQATNLLEAIQCLQNLSGLPRPVRVIDGAINIYALRHEEHVVAYATTVDAPPDQGMLVLLTAFHERDWQLGFDRAEFLARRVFRSDAS